MSTFLDEGLGALNGNGGRTGAPDPGETFDSNLDFGRQIPVSHDEIGHQQTLQWTEMQWLRPGDLNQMDLKRGAMIRFLCYSAHVGRRPGSRKMFGGKVTSR